MLQKYIWYIYISKRIYVLKEYLNKYTFWKNLKIENPNIRFYINIRRKLGIKTDDVYQELKAAIPDQHPSRKTVFKWFAHFRDGREHLKDLPRTGRPITETNTTHIQRVRTIIEEDPWCTYDDIESSLSRGTIQRIIHEHLKQKKVTSRWVPHQLTEQKSPKPSSHLPR